jgi:hypothetical protein
MKEEASVGGSLTLMNTRSTLGQSVRNELCRLWRIRVRAHECVVEFEGHVISPWSAQAWPADARLV